MTSTQAIQEVAAAVGIAEGEAGVRSVLAVIAQREPIAIRDISFESELPVPIVAAICNELRKREVLAAGSPVRLAPATRRSLDSPGLALESACPTCDGLGLVIPDELEGVLERLDTSADKAPPVRVEIDQSHCTVETKVRRVLAMHEARALLWRRVLFLGDDDLTSLAVAEVANSVGFAADVEQLAVVDVDQRVLDFLKPRLAELGVAVTLVRHDLREPLPSELRGRFDTVFTDPPYTGVGAELFLSRAVSALAGPGADIFFAFGARNPTEVLKAQATIARMGLVVRSLVRHFNEYVGAGILGGTSHLYHLISTSAAEPGVTGSFSGPIYTGDTPRPPRTYVCTQCETPQRVGPRERFTTIDELVEAGCPRCGGTTFKPGRRGS